MHNNNNLHQNLSNQTQHHAGFTLIELVVVIIILGIIAVIAAPRFLSVADEAHASGIQGVSGAFEGFDELVFAKSAILGIEKNDRNSSSSSTDSQGGFYLETGEFVQTIFGHPWLYNQDALTYLLDASLQDEGQNQPDKECVTNSDFCFMLFEGSSGPTSIGVAYIPGNSVAVYYPSYSVSDQCFAYYVFDRTDNNVIIGETITGC
ncbi:MULTISPECIES: prepilin-type N-terminal cleavage/methylation domain-containing protein [Shewanella]|uniref:Prepilin-type N-terminal cleavage/methylation domain-containing protein n=1 Tax=Shewanella japonica TaxID=93973 RepID=A0ABM6JN25_9GAMM|nr:MULTISPECIES: prepilin-type N-terminal cleavage/methylation domain-containing protein [Shewanella]ARD22885.1 hypothetical protein SJ2017_2596 [Shewanella japonica]KPZ70496.1 hypothetical protein AN944_02244 [Shewanella sp. P1-14-1]